MKRLALLACVIAAMSLGACATVRDGPVGAAIDVVEAPAIMLLEAKFAAELGEAEAAVANGVTAAEAETIAGQAELAMNGLVAARIAYDLTLRPTALPATVVMVERARSATDVAYQSLMDRLVPIISPPI